ncbi:tumor necrosis factor ligand superfamily member 6-like [Physella acuta]|uniref:tumor necrosis factor ligand superfamily member 6-like n=1 Tax=Physella acuta TaxID=109671 RepID=UPI0027DE9F64|nr:tumor necrosis factor ligand superfamily member 6-like [Physella acuta]
MWLHKKSSPLDITYDIVSARGSGDSVSFVHSRETPVKCYQRLVLALALFAILLCTAVLVIGIVLFTSHSTSETNDKDKPIACVSCNKLIKTTYDTSASDPLFDMLVRVRDAHGGSDLCCAYDSEQMSALLEMSMRRQDVNKAPLQSFNVSDFSFSPASTHKRLFPPKNPYPEMPYQERVPQFGNGSVVVLFKNENVTADPLVEHERGVEILKDGIRIIHPGLYYVYSSIHFRPESAHPCKNFKYQTWGHYVEKISPNNPAQTGCLLKTAHTCCDACTMDEETSYTGGVFHLESGDVIRIVISGYGLVYFRQQTSFAGLMMLGNSNIPAQK